METLLCSPATRTDIVLGKFLMVLTGSLASVAFSLISLSFSLLVIGSTIGTATRGMGPAGEMAPTIDPLGILGVLAMVLPVAVLFSAVVFTVCLFAKSAKEAQSYVTPLVFIIIFPCGIGLLPGIELNYHLAMVPIANVSLVCKEMLSGVWHWGYIAVIFGSTAALRGGGPGAGRRDVQARGRDFPHLISKYPYERRLASCKRRVKWAPANSYRKPNMI